MKSSPLSFLRGAFKKGPYLGVDIGTTSIKVSELERAKQGLQLKDYGMLETYGYLERANSAFQTSTLKLSEKEIAGYLRIVLEKMRVKNRNVIISVPSFSSFSTLVEIPSSSDREIANIMQFQAKQYVPLPINEVSLDWQKVGERVDESGAKRDQILLIAVVNEQIQRLKHVLDAVKLKLVAVEAEGVGTARSLTQGIKESVMVVDIGSRSTGMFVAQNGMLKFTGQTDFSGGSLTQSIANGLNINMFRAEDLKKQRGLTQVAGEQELSTLMQVMLDVIIKEASRVRSKFETTYREKVAKIILSGGGANLLGIEEYMGKGMDIPVVKANPFSNVIHFPSIDPIAKELGPLLAVSIGLGMKDTVS